MTTHYSKDPFGSAALANLVANLPPPLRSGGGSVREHPLDPEGRATALALVTNTLVLVKLKRSLDRHGLRVVAAVGGDVRTLCFAPYTEHGALLIAAAPRGEGALDEPLPDDSPTDESLSLQLELAPRPDRSDLVNIPVEDLGDWISVVVAEGVLGKLLYVLSSEKQQIRRQMRTVLAARRLDRATGATLDRMGADVGVPRFEAELRFAGGELFGQAFADGIEPDDAYRGRLLLWRQFATPNRTHLLRWLNGDSHGPGAMARAGYVGRFTVDESDPPLGLALRLVGLGDDAALDGIHQRIVQHHFARPGATVELREGMSDEQRAARQTDWDALRDAFEWPPQAQLATKLGRALLAFAQVRDALGWPSPPKVIRAYDRSEPGYELGLRVDLEAIDDLEALVAAATDPDRTLDDPDLERLVRSVVPAEDMSSEDWMAAVFGLSLTHTAGLASVSTVPSHGLRVDGPSVIPLGQDGRVELTAGGFDDPLAISSTRWFVVPLDAAEASIEPRGPTSELTAKSAGAAVVVAACFAQDGPPQPYEIRIDVAPGSPPLTLPQYEYLMNLLDRVRPLGVRVDTRPIHQEHVDPEGTGAMPLTASVSQRYRSFERSRFKLTHERSPR
ncbi:MAG: hypothetical protein AAGF12_22125 [Myxococcota bacterium]